MNIQSRLPTTPDEFLRWNEGREGKREFVNGKVVEMMINVTRNHARIATNTLVALARRLDLGRFDVGSADFGVRTPDGIRYPDVYVDHKTDASRGDDLAATEPVMLVEILSSSSYGRDFVEKLADYSKVASLRHYLILSQDDPRAWLWSRGDSSEWTGPKEIVGADEKVELQALAIALDMSELFAGIGH